MTHEIGDLMRIVVNGSSSWFTSAVLRSPRWLKLLRYRGLAEDPKTLLACVRLIRRSGAAERALCRFCHASPATSSTSPVTKWILARNKEACERKGKGRCIRFAESASLVKSHGRTMHFWADVI